MGCLGINVVNLYMSWLHKQYKKLGLQPRTISIHDGTTNIHCWVPEAEEHRSKPPLLLIHGFGADGCLTWGAQVKQLSSSFALYVPDLVFFGGSTTSSSQRSESFQADCLVALLQQLRVESVDVVGTSYGGFVAFRIAEAHPQMVRKLVIADSGVCMTPSSNDHLLQELGVQHVHEVLMPTSVDVQKRSLNRAVFKSTFIPEFVVKDLMERFGFNREERIQLLEALSFGSPSAQPLPKLPPTQEVLVLWGEKDRIFDVCLAYELQKHLGPTCKVITIANAGHLPQMEKPKEFNTHILDFLEGA